MDKGIVLLVELHGGYLRVVQIVLDLLQELHQVKGVQHVIDTDTSRAVFWLWAAGAGARTLWCGP